MKPFNLEEAKAGKPVCTRDGKPVRIICFDRNEKTYPIIALVDKGPFEVVYTYTNEGKYNFEGFSDFDLLIVPIKKKGWVNIYKKNITNNITDRGGGYIFPTKEQALNAVMSGQGYVTTTEIEWEE